MPELPKNNHEAASIKDSPGYKGAGIRKLLGINRSIGVWFILWGIVITLALPALYLSHRNAVRNERNLQQSFYENRLINTIKGYEIGSTADIMDYDTSLLKSIAQTYQVIQRRNLSYADRQKLEEATFESKIGFVQHIMRMHPEEETRPSK